MEWLNTLDNFEFIIVVGVVSALCGSLAVIAGDWIARKWQARKVAQGMAENMRKDVIK